MVRNWAAGRKRSAAFFMGLSLADLSRPLKNDSLPVIASEAKQSR
jgi:hypothetical protein